MRLYNTLTRNVDEFAPLQDNTVRIYSCGPTVYDHAHIGNLSAYIFADTLRRALQASGYDIQHAMNYTDVDDKTIRKSRERHADLEPREALQKLTDHYIGIFNEDMARIGNDIRTLQFIRATDEGVIAGMQELIAKLHTAGFAYIADDGVYFSIEAYKQSGKTYGQLTEITAQNTSAARIQNDEYDKESVHDFALWKKQKEGEPAWDFTLDGQNLAGRPGWHIECSVMSRQLLDQPFDIHTGGVDLIFPHHENEIAQSTALEENPTMARFFAHNEHILVDGKKMSKSLGNFFTLEDVVQKGYDPLVFRLSILQAHYRSQVNLSWDGLNASRASLRNMRNDMSWFYHSGIMHDKPLEGLEESFKGFKKNILEALQDDLNTPKALALLHEYTSNFATMPASQLDIPVVEDFATFIQDLLGISILDKRGLSSEQQQLVTQREEARKDKDWQKSDELRDQLAEQGIGLRDTQSGSIWYRKER